MSSKIETLENNKVKLTIEVAPERFEEGLQHAYLENRGKINVQGFRKGKAPRKLIEAQFGKEIFYEDAINYVMPDAYEAAVDEHKLSVVSRPEIDVLESDGEKGVVFTAVVYVKPQVVIGDYLGIKYEKPDSVVSDAELAAEIDKAREKNARLITVTDRSLQAGDIAVIDFEGFVGGTAFEGGKGTDYELTIGSHTFIDTFEDQLVGANTGDKLDVNVTFPDGYGNTELASKPALFKVEIKGIKFKELPEANDEFAQDVSEFETFDEYKNDLLAKLQIQKDEAAKSEIEGKVLEQLVKIAEADVPEAMIENETDQMLRDFDRRLRSSGLNMESYLNYMGGNMNDFRAAQREKAEASVRTRLALEAVAEKENFSVTEEEVNAELELVAKAYGMEMDKLASVMGEKEKEGVKNDLKVQKALKLVIDSATAV